MDCCLTKCLSLICEVDIVLACALPLVRGCIGWERSCVLPNCICPNLQWRFPVWEVLCGRVSGNPSVWRRGRRAVCSNLETYLCVCVWSTFSNSLSFILYLASFILLIHTYMLGCVCLCALLVLTKRASYSTSTLIYRNLEEIVQSPSPGIRLHTLVTLSVLQLVFLIPHYLLLD